jgi:tetratricopeptide (TPR) repeat protein
MRIALLILFLTTRLSAQDSFVISGAFADSLYTKENYSAAIKEYQRYLFQNNIQDASIYMKVGDAYGKLNNWNQAELFFDKAYFEANSDSIRLRATIKKASALVGQKRYLDAQVELFQIDRLNTGSAIQEIHFLEGIIYFALNDYEKSQQSFTQIVNSDSLKVGELNDLYADINQLEKPKLRTARILSSIIPGSGQLYAGNGQEALNSLLLTGGLISLGVVMAIQISYVDALITIIPWFQRYYFGGLENVDELVAHKKAVKKEEFYRKILLIISE